MDFELLLDDEFTQNGYNEWRGRTDVGVVVVRAAKSQGLRLKGVGYIFYKALCMMLGRLRIRRIRVKSIV